SPFSGRGPLLGRAELLYHPRCRARRGSCEGDTGARASGRAARILQDFRRAARLILVTVNSGSRWEVPVKHLSRLVIPAVILLAMWAAPASLRAQPGPAPAPRPGTEGAPKKGPAATPEQVPF